MKVLICFEICCTARCIKLEFSGKTSANNFALSHTEANTWRPLNGGQITITFVFNYSTEHYLQLSNNHKSQVYEMLKTPLNCISMNKLDSLKNCSSAIAGLSEHGLRYSRFILLVRTNVWIKKVSKKRLWKGFGSAVSSEIENESSSELSSLVNIIIIVTHPLPNWRGVMSLRISRKGNETFQI